MPAQLRIQETLLSEWAESSVGGGGKRGPEGMPHSPDHGSGARTGRVGPGPSHHVRGSPTGRRRPRRPAQSAPAPRPSRLRTRGPPGPARAHLTFPQLRAPGPARARLHRGYARSADSRGRALGVGAGPREAGPRNGWGYVEVGDGVRQGSRLIGTYQQLQATYLARKEPGAHFTRNRRRGERT